MGGSSTSNHLGGASAGTTQVFVDKGFVVDCKIFPPPLRPSLPHSALLLTSLTLPTPQPSCTFTSPLPCKPRMQNSISMLPSCKQHSANLCARLYCLSVCSPPPHTVTVSAGAQERDARAGITHRAPSILNDGQAR